MRLKDPLHIPKIISKAKEYLGRRYDNSFGWNDKECRDFYCSELVYEVFEKGAGVGLAR